MDLLFFTTALAVIVGVLLLTFKLLKVSLKKLIIGVLGLIIGLLISALFNTAISKIPGIIGEFMPVVISIMLGLAGIYIFITQEKLILNFFERFFKDLKFLKMTSEAEKVEVMTVGRQELVVDTSVIIDGRIEDILKTGFILGKLIIPKAVIHEMHKISDSHDNLKRSRGRRGLEILENMRKMKNVDLQIIEDDFPDIKEVDEKLIRIAKKRKSYILTIDYNLNKVAQIQKINVLNINELANALRAIILPGEQLEIKVVQEGKEKKQGVGYLPDGTMVVIEGGDKYIGETVNAEVSRIFQTVAGRMIFAEPRKIKENNG
ncbi:hypothetical protein COX95_00565 [bacterium CG_4_10_14_0_2_um_filter_33_32]|nr:MAG: hypothetical protein AUJ93_04500 [bacterium CG2_30_33_46]PIU76974.1 MAG: hypothetical protein COS74_01170 [bacterium CG06_land_8_20_14_3_00_33_50]PIW81438.1 MAG: hypothetical protein COZ97_01715 [bacterium CG_4_8_14_3_um_filter_33_28]PIY85355.1 MAG: hypothetical protein COY76_02530 [bacterium CG_4_10_14_0_8_um_filter_33_57]PIZ86620.1 MAG: hypothetical protein COX95_00565 [bacterium CG_4_10_14_0_2_um_filter_33_32]PJA72678.1 MAG: hypothetical protein CO152_00095 [bacterium CG_4_9_14_3_um